MIFIKSAREIAIMKQANVIVAEILEELKETARAGVSTLELDALAEELVQKIRDSCRAYWRRETRDYHRQQEGVRQ